MAASVVPSQSVSKPSEEKKRRLKKKSLQMFQSEKFWNKKTMAFLNSSSVCLNQFQCYQVSLETKVFESRGSKCSLLKSKLNFQKDFMVFL